jgi:hypothetical protein
MALQQPLPAWLYRDARAYRVHMPPDVTVAAACEDVGCDQWRFGWETVCDLTDLTPATGGAAVAALIRSGKTGRTYRELTHAPDASVAVFRFESGQRCFAEHRTRPGELLVYSRGRRVAEHFSFRDIAEDYTEHAGRLAEQEKRG